MEHYLAIRTSKWCSDGLALVDASNKVIQFLS
jgi:hypothetical protein